MKSLYKICSVAGFLAVAVTFSGCTKIQSSSPEDGYNTDVAMSAVEYSIFLSKQISVLENVLTTRMAMADSVANGTYEVSKEIQSTEEKSLIIWKETVWQKEICLKYSVYSVRSDRTRILYVQNAGKRIHTKELLLLYIL